MIPGLESYTEGFNVSLLGLALFPKKNFPQKVGYLAHNHILELRATVKTGRTGSSKRPKAGENVVAFSLFCRKYFIIFNPSMSKLHAPPFKHEHNSKAIPQGVSNIKEQGENNDTQAIADFLGFDLIIVVRWFYRLFYN